MKRRSGSWVAVIGLEVHVQLNTRIKLFSRSASESELTLPNSNANLVDLAYPGTLPVLNPTALAQAIRFGVAVDAPIAQVCVFERKNYFYPDLPKGYQITQHSHPIVGAGVFRLCLENGDTKPIRIRQAHLEEDAGKSIHDRFPNATALDYNRAGTALLEIVTEPDLRTPSEAAACFRQLRALVVWLNLCSGRLNEGAMRCDANVSVRPSTATSFGTSTEIKNINSFKYLEKALEFEISRQTDLRKAGREVVHETRLYDPASHSTRAMRRKEQRTDYRYFPDPDLPPIPIARDLIDQIIADTPELPMTRRNRFLRQYGLTPINAYRLTLERPLADLFEATSELCDAPKEAANWILGEVRALAKLKNTHDQRIVISPKQLAQLIKRVEDGTITTRTGKELLRTLWDTDLETDQVIRTRNLAQNTDCRQISTWVAQVMTDNQQLLPNVLDGKQQIFDFLIGQVMILSQGTANPQQVKKVLDRQIRIHKKQLSVEKDK